MTHKGIRGSIINILFAALSGALIAGAEAIITYVLDKPKKKTSHPRKRKGGKSIPTTLQ